MDVSKRRIVILGKTGVGKSSVANTIFEEELFQIDHSSESDNSKCKAETRPVNGRNITLIDTPGLFDNHRSEKELKSEIVRSIIEFAPGPHAFLILLKIEKYTKHEHEVITNINKYFSEEVFKYATVLFTHGDQLREGKTIEDFVHDNDLLSNLVKKCGGRCHVIDNKYWKNNQQEEYRNNQFQVKELLNTIDEMVEANKGRCYTNEMLQAVEEKIKEEMQLIRQSAGNKSEEEIREEAKESVFKRFLINLAGITTGVLLGALFGVVVLFEQFYTFLKKPESGAAAAAAAVIEITAKIGSVSAAGAIQGGLAGYDAAKKAETPGEAAKMAAECVMKDVRAVFRAQDNSAENQSESKPSISP